MKFNFNRPTKILLTTSKIKIILIIFSHYRKTPFLIPDTKSRTNKSDRDLELGIN